VVGAASQRANSVAKVSGQGTQTPAREVGEQPASDVVRAHNLKRRLATGQPAKERPLEWGEVDDGWCRLRRECRRIVSQLAPGEKVIHTVPHHGLRETCDSRNGGWNCLALWKRDEVRTPVRDCETAPSPRNLEEMAARSRSRGLAINHQHLELRERQHGLKADRHR
jgi:hypothetical protein